ncbi:hypothetical protein CEH05_14645 [Halobacillus halophilus]|uniref:DUF4129 domain-containing protein n=1 Tax=Halobacillus halophilus (strain ATCC 35676 / DSM 2266 / JCM 20832 / KCTC 3685 / LMG 17431 / NBRC 102448 / NCIMB 2269) TaxID=866895 RepID=I0JQ78_HALH3|nr:hypothetical protein [Halobacillus halophilus]ASF40315.1 hypothetical protein CEH05_14645 [Halobacillus halophilus]CCG46298.1 hypothetical protein HBHAL_3956 [Halobacillus halophilus DSM 2266]
MISGNKLTVMSYQFVSEGLAFFFFLFLMGRWSWVSLQLPLISFITVVILSLLFFLGASKLSSSFLPFIIVAALLAGIGVVMGVPLVFSLMLSGFLVWRYLLHEQEPDRENERFMLFLTTIMAFVCMLFFAQIEIIIILALQYGVIILGYFFSHYIEVSKSDRKKGKKKIVFLIFGFAAGASTLAALFQPLRLLITSSWQAVSIVFLKGVQGFFFIVELTGFEVSEIEPLAKLNQDQDSSEMFRDSNEPPSSEAGEPSQQLADAAQAGTVILLIVGIILILYIMYRLRNKKRTDRVDRQMLTYKSYGLQYGDEDHEAAWRFKRSPADGPVRKHFLQFERYAQKCGLGRKYNEPIQKWFDRIGITANNIHLYQKVRYGNEQLSKEEESLFYNEIRELEKQLASKENKK